jgi:uncharacterized SAM-binding protein YcdF (DUF218 family)
MGFIFLVLNRKKIGSVIFISALLAFYLLSIRPIAFLLLQPLEYHYPTYNNQAANFIHVLGNGHIEDASLPITSQLSYTSTLRVVEAVRIYHLQPNATLVLTGYAGINTTISTAKMHAQLAMELGVPQDHIVIDERPRDTEEETQALARLVNNQPTIVITSASHMRRAMGYYQQYNINAISAPTMHLSRQHIPWTNADVYPSSEYLRMSQLAIHEWLGIVYQKMH